MLNYHVKIQLLDTNAGYLEVLDGTTFPVNFAVGDIRDLSKRTGTFTKSITLAGTKNNAKMLNHYYDLNVQSGTFDINKRQRCSVLQNNVVIIQEAYLQLISVNKTQNNLTEDDKVTYTVQIKDAAGNFFTDITGKELTDLEIVLQTPLLYTAQEQVNSWPHTYQNIYKYILPYNNDPNNPVTNQWNWKTLHPAIFAKWYWDKIHETSGYTYEWLEQFTPEIQFDKLLIPFNGDPTKVALPINYTQNNTVEVNLPSTNPQTYPDNGVPNSTNFAQNFWYQFLLGPNAITDPNNEWNPYVPNNQWRPSVSVRPPDKFIYEIDIDFDYFVDSNIGCNFHAVNKDMQVHLAVLNTSQNIVAAGQVTPCKLRFDTIAPGNWVQYGPGSDITKLRWVVDPTAITGTSKNFTSGSTLLASGVGKYFLDPSLFNNGDNLELRIFVDSYDATNNRTPSNAAVATKVVVKSANLKIYPYPNAGLINGMPVDLNVFIPKKVKQSDFIRSICTMFNLYCESSPNIPNHLIYKTRDKFYDSGLVADWTTKLARDKEQEITFLPELTSKSILLTWKHDDKNPLLKSYKDNLKKDYGQIRFTYDNEWVKGEDKKEIIFSPGPVVEQQAEGCSLLYYEDPFKPETNIMCVFDGGPKPLNQGVNCSVNDYFGNVVFSFYPYVGHFNDPKTPSYDLNFGVCDYYPTNIPVTQNNLYYKFWPRTISSINTGKMLSAYFWLTEADIHLLRLNYIIRIDNGYFTINRIIDYDPSKYGLTKVELITLEKEMSTLALLSGSEVKPYDPKDFVDTVLGGGVVEAGPRGDLVKDRKKVVKNLVTARNNIADNIGNFEIYGTDNQLTSNFYGVIVGNNILANEPGVYVGEYRLTELGLQYTGLKIIDGGVNQVMNLNKTNEIDYIDGGEDVVRRLQGSKARPFIDGGNKRYIN
jgi:hypothetical protein